MSTSIRHAFVIVSVVALACAVAPTLGALPAQAAAHARHMRHAAAPVNGFGWGYTAPRHGAYDDGYLCQTDEGQGRTLPCDSGS
jgi:hypothetical protein